MHKQIVLGTFHTGIEIKTGRGNDMPAAVLCAAIVLESSGDVFGA
jgi:hypothetical protein